MHSRQEQFSKRYYLSHRIKYGESGGDNDLNVYFIKPSGGTKKIYDGLGHYCYVNTLYSI